MKIRGADFVLFQVTDMPRAARFYREDLGLQQEVDTEDFAEFNCGNVTLSLISAGEMEAVGHIALAVDDVEDSRKKRTKFLLKEGK